jgi:multiple sugar transport system substrate-binding protein
VEVRLKAVSGTGGLLDSLTTANAAAPLAIPDLIALPQALMESAVLQGLIYPFDGLTTAMDDHEWYEYARQLGQLQNSVYGLPFAGDALTMAYRPVLIETPPRDWEATTAISGTLAFPAADPQALFTLLQYQAAGGAVQNEQGQPILEEESLVEVLNFFQTAEMTGVMPFWLTQFENFDQVWESFSGRQSSMAVSWFSSYQNHYESLPTHPEMAVLPTPDGRDYTLGTGWVWAIASSKPDRHELSARLAEYLLEDTFLGQWTFETGYLPPHSGALDNWRDVQLRTLMHQIQSSAHLLPSTEVIAQLGPLLKQAAVDVLKEQSDPFSAARTAIESLENR